MVSRAELAALGFSSHEVAARVAAGRLIPVFAGTFAHGAVPLGADGRRLAAVLSCGPGALLSHRSAAELGGLLPERRIPGPPHVTVPRDGPRRRAGIVVHGASGLESSAGRGIPCTTVERTLVDCAGQRGNLDLEDAVARAVRDHALDVEGLLAILDSGRRFRGARALRRILAESDPRSGPTRSELERRLLILCRRHGLPRPLVNAVLDVGLSQPLEVDFLWPAERVVVELDSFAFHADPSRIVEDRRRDVALTLAAYERLRFTWADVTRRPASTAAQIRSLLRRRARSTAGTA